MKSIALVSVADEMSAKIIYLLCKLPYVVETLELNGPLAVSPRLLVASAFYGLVRRRINNELV